MRHRLSCLGRHTLLLALPCLGVLISLALCYPRSCKVSMAQIKRYLGSVVTLEKLQFHHTPLLGKSKTCLAKALCGLHSLTASQISAAKSITEHIMARIAQLTGLQDLDLSGLTVSRSKLIALWKTRQSVCYKQLLVLIMIRSAIIADVERVADRVTCISNCAFVKSRHNRGGCFCRRISVISKTICRP